MTGELINHLWQSTVFAVVAGVLTLALRNNRAQVRYWVWLVASVKFLVPFALLMNLGSVVPRPVKTVAVSPAVAVRMVEIVEPFPEAPSPAVPRSEVPWLWIVWACGFAGITMMRLRGWARVRAAVRASTAVQIPAAVEVRSAPGLLEPGVVGVLRPILLLPEGIAEQLTPAQLDAVLAHELCHVRRRDNLAAAIHMIVEALFWFHPLVWWIGGRLVEERERACDEEVLRLGGDPRDYADAILNVCKLYVESPLACVAGVTGADLKKRIEAIMSNRILSNLTVGRKAGLAVASMMAVTAPVAIGVLRAQTTATPKFEVASIRLSKDCGGPAGVAERPSPGRLTKKCMPLSSYIQAAYVWFDKGRQNALRSLPLSGGPAWVESDLYEINAKAEGDPGQVRMSGPMMQALLEDRFRLKIHRETREVPVYALTVAKSGPKLTPFQEGSCTPLDIDTLGPRQPGDKPLCHPGWIQGKGANISIDAQAMGVDEFSKFLQLMLDRPVIDKTGIAGRFDFRVEFAPDDMTSRFATGTPGARSLDSTGGGPVLREAIQEQLGLKLESTKGPGEFLVIDHIERPSEN